MIVAQRSSMLRAHAKGRDYFFHYTAGELSTENPLQAPTETTSELQTALDHDSFQWMMLFHVIGGGSGNL